METKLLSEKYRFKSEGNIPGTDGQAAFDVEINFLEGQYTITLVCPSGPKTPLMLNRYIDQIGMQNGTTETLFYIKTFTSIVKEIERKLASHNMDFKGKSLDYPTAAGQLTPFGKFAHEVQQMKLPDFCQWCLDGNYLSETAITILKSYLVNIFSVTDFAEITDTSMLEVAAKINREHMKKSFSNNQMTFLKIMEILLYHDLKL
jgi:hypothetical protein